MGYKHKDVKIHSKTIFISISEYWLSLLKPALSSEKQQIPPILEWCTVNAQGKPQTLMPQKQSIATSSQSTNKSQTAKWMLFFTIDNIWGGKKKRAGG